MEVKVMTEDDKKNKTYMLDCPFRQIDLEEGCAKLEAAEGMKFKVSSMSETSNESIKTISVKVTRLGKRGQETHSSWTFKKSGKDPECKLYANNKYLIIDWSIGEYKESISVVRLKTLKTVANVVMPDKDMS
jgi:hypothetical protein